MNRLKKQKGRKTHKRNMQTKTRKNGNGIEYGRKLAAAMEAPSLKVRAALETLETLAKEASSEVHQS